MIERLRRLVETPSVSRQEAAVADVVAAELEAAGLSVRRRGHNLWTQFGDAPRPRLLLNSHLDTVPPGQGWSGDPWTLRADGDRWLGLGANDAKGCVNALIEAALEVHDASRSGQALGGTVVLALTAEEEITGAGLGTILEDVGPIDAAVVGEPTGLVPMIAQRGLLILRCEANGRTGHPANTPSDCDSNAIAGAARDIVAIHGYDWGPPHELLGACHAHVTMIEGGVARNVIPDRCVFYVDVRTTPNQPHARTVARLQRDLDAEVHVHSDRLAPVETAAGEKIVLAALRAVPGVRPAGSPAMSDMVFLAGVPAVKMGPGDTRRSHTPDEYVTERELLAGAAAYQALIRAYLAAFGGAR